MSIVSAEGWGGDTKTLCKHQSCRNIRGPGLKVCTNGTMAPLGWKTLCTRTIKTFLSHHFLFSISFSLLSISPSYTLKNISSVHFWNFTPNIEQNHTFIIQWGGPINKKWKSWVFQVRDLKVMSSWSCITCCKMSNKNVSRLKITHNVPTHNHSNNSGLKVKISDVKSRYSPATTFLSRRESLISSQSLTSENLSLESLSHTPQFCRR